MIHSAVMLHMLHSIFKVLFNCSEQKICNLILNEDGLAVLFALTIYCMSHSEAQSVGLTVVDCNTHSLFHCLLCTHLMQSLVTEWLKVMGKCWNIVMKGNKDFREKDEGETHLISSHSSSKILSSPNAEKCMWLSQAARE